MLVEGGLNGGCDVVCRVSKLDFTLCTEAKEVQTGMVMGAFPVGVGVLVVAVGVVSHCSCKKALSGQFRFSNVDCMLFENSGGSFRIQIWFKEKRRGTVSNGKCGGFQG